MTDRPSKVPRLSSTNSKSTTNSNTTPSSRQGSPNNTRSEDQEHKNAEQDRLDFDGQFSQIGTREYLNLDPRPSFVVDLSADLDFGARVMFCNKSFQSDPRLVSTFASIIKSKPNKDSPYVASGTFVSWIKDLVRRDGRELPDLTSWSYLGVSWTGFVVFRRWGVISGSYHVLDRTAAAANGDATKSSSRKRQASNRPDFSSPQGSLRTLSDSSGTPNSLVSDLSLPQFATTGCPDWTLANPAGNLPPHIVFARSFDWGSTPVKSMSSWTPEFRQIANLIMANPHPAALFWGAELTVMYNRAYAEGVAGHKHPGLMGTGFRGPFAELWSIVGPTFAECTRTGNAVAVTNQMLPIHRGSLLEETFFSWTLTPLYGGTRNLLGFYNAPFETTKQTLTDRRMRTLLHLSEELALAQSVSTFWTHILKPLQENEFDFPFALLYSVLDDTEADEVSSTSSESSSSYKSCMLEGAIGVPPDHPAAQSRVDLKRSRGGFIPAFRDAMQTWEPKQLSVSDGTLPESLIEGFNWRGFPEPCREAVVCPLRPTTGENVLGFLVVGINPVITSPSVTLEACESANVNDSGDLTTTITKPSYCF